MLAMLAACGGASSQAVQATGGRPGGAGSGPATHAAGASPCGPRRAHTLAAGRLARVYSLGGSVLGCSAHGRRSYRLGSASRSIAEGRAGPAAVAGEDVAYGLTTYGVDTASTVVIVRDLRDGARLRSLPATTAPLRPESFQSVTAIAVKADGAVAWIGQAGSVISGKPTTEVHGADRRGPALLDAGAGIAPRSLRLRGSTLSWTDGGRTRRAALR
jgi:hypothetical protein